MDSGGLRTGLGRRISRGSGVRFLIESLDRIDDPGPEDQRHHRDRPRARAAGAGRRATRMRAAAPPRFQRLIPPQPPKLACREPCRRQRRAVPEQRELSGRGARCARLDAKRPRGPSRWRSGDSTRRSRAVATPAQLSGTRRVGEQSSHWPAADDAAIRRIVSERSLGMLDVVIERPRQVGDRAQRPGNKRDPVVVVEVADPGRERQHVVEQATPKQRRRHRSPSCRAAATRSCRGSAAAGSSRYRTPPPRADRTIRASLKAKTEPPVAASRALELRRVPAIVLIAERHVGGLGGDHCERPLKFA